MASELARAYVVTSVYTPNTHQPTVGHNPMTGDEMLGLLGLHIVNTGEGSMLENDPNATPTTTGLDCYGNTSTFLVVRIVMASSTPLATFGAFTLGTHTIDISYERIKSKMGEYDQSYTESQLKDTIRQTILHEISHVLINGNDTDTGVRKSPIALEEKLQTAYQQFQPEDLKLIQLYSRAND